MCCEITPTRATYWIDGQEYASCIYQSGAVPDSGYVGFGINEGEALKASYSYKGGRLQKSLKGFGNKREGDVKIVDNVKVI